AAGGRASNDRARLTRVNAALARALFWRGQYADAEAILGTFPEEEGPTATCRHACLAARIAVGRRDAARAMTLAALAGEHAREGGAGDRALAAHTAGFVHLGVNDYDAVERDVSASILAARQAYDPLRALRARLLRAEADRRRGRNATSVAQLSRLKRLAVTMPPILRTPWELLTALASGGDPDAILRRHRAASGLGALELLVPGPVAEPPPALGEAAADALVAILRACQKAEDETAVLKEVCACVRHQLHAAAVAFVASQNGRSEVIAGHGERTSVAEHGAIAARVLDAGVAIAPHRKDD